MKTAAPQTMELLNQFPRCPRLQAQQLLNQELASFDKKIVVLDDDPTGIQTVHGVSVYTDWSRESVLSGFQEASPLFFILTNSRSMSRIQTETVHKEIAQVLASVSLELHQDFILISRGDSTLRGHYPLETETLKNCLENHLGCCFDGEILYPFFQEGGRCTIHQVHYVKDGNKLIPAGMTEFARDKSFGYHSSNLADWCEEKTNGTYLASDMIKIPLDELRTMKLQEIQKKLEQAYGFNKILVDSIEETDVMIFMIAFLRAVRSGKRFLFRSAAAVPKVLGNISSRPLLTRAELMSESSHGGIVLIGSHVDRTTRQLEELKRSPCPLTFLEFQASRVHEDGGLAKETDRVRKLAETELQSGRTAVIYTSRTLVSTDSDDKDKILETSVKISEALTKIIGNLSVRPSFILAKGGITSSDVGTKALHVKRATVMGQVKPGIPVWMTGAESKFPGLPYIIFPGNVGEVEALREIMELLI